MKLVFWAKFILGASFRWVSTCAPNERIGCICFFVIERQEQQQHQHRQDDTLSYSSSFAYCHCRIEWKVFDILVSEPVVCVRVFWGERNKVSWLVVQCARDWNQMKNIKLLEIYCLRHRCELHQFVWVVFISYSPFNNRISNFLLLLRCLSLNVAPWWLFNSLFEQLRAGCFFSTILKSRKNVRRDNQS